MKRFLLLGFLLLSFGQMPVSAQQYEDDIYYNSKDAQKDAEKAKNRPSTKQSSRNNGQTYNSSNDEGTVYEEDDRTALSGNNNYDIDDEDYGYSARISRFSYPTYRIGYYSPWYDPFYDPWYSPFWGPSMSLSFGWGWGGGWGGSYFGMGYPMGYYSPWGWGGYGGWGRPWGWGGYGGYGWGGGGYYNGFYDGYHAGGGYGGGGYRRNISYGPRTSMSMPRTTGAYRSSNYNGGTSGPRGGGRGQLKQEPGFDRSNNNMSTRPSRRLPDQGIGSQNGTQERPAPAVNERPSRFRIFGNGSGNRSTNENTQQSAPAQERRSRQYNSSPSYERRSSPSYERSSPSSSPSRSSGGFSSPRGGSSSGGGGGRRSR